MSQRKKNGTGAGLVQFCPRFHLAIELVGRRWSGAIIRLLLSGPRRFNELVAAVPGLSDRLLAERLRELESAGVVRRLVDTGTPIRVAYALTPAGTELESTIRSLAAWAERWVPAATLPKASHALPSPSPAGARRKALRRSP